MKKQALTLLAGTALLAGSLPAQASDESPRRVVGHDEASNHRVAVVGDELRPERIPANANYVLYFDLENFKRTSLWKMVQEHKSEKLDLDEALEDLREFEREFGIDPLKDVKSFLVYGTRGDDEPSAIQIVVNEKVDQAIGALRLRPGYKALDHEGYRIHSFADGSNDRVHAYVQELRGGDRVIVLSENIEAVHECALVLNGQAPSLRGAGSGLKLTPSQSSFLHLSAADVPGLDSFEPASQLFGLAQGIQFDFGEAGGSLFANLTLETSSPDTARDISDTVQGLLALARIALREENGIPSEAAELLRALQVSTRGSSVTVDFQYSTAALFELMEAVDEGGLDW